MGEVYLAYDSKLRRKVAISLRTWVYCVAHNVATRQRV